MSRRKKGNPVHGWLVLDKPPGPTSTQAVGRVKRLFQAQKAGHAGTLDPLAAGLLPIALGEATKTVAVAVDGTKSYRFAVRWGAQTRTDDSEGDIVEVSARRPGRADIEALLPTFAGEILQVPPQFSAIKIAGRRAYDLARDGENLTLTPRRVLVMSLRLAAQPDEDTAVFEAECGKGTYVRALARDMGRMLGCFAHMTALRRTRVGPFTEAQAITLDRLEALPQEEAAALHATLLPVEAALAGWMALDVGPADAGCLKRGQSVILRGRDAPILSGPAYAVCKGQLVALVEIDRGELCPTRVFNLA
ncbi:MAG: tRNA pseudouridine(55) synthase TruB [Hyphomicrobiaceae bacterium]